MKKNRFDISVLVVEDEVDVLEQLLLIIGRRVKQTFGAKDGKEALEIYERESIDLIISDIVIPLMDGLDFLKKIRE
jgi:CheY-like chemotaxis protein